MYHHSLEIVNVDRLLSAAFGGDPSEHDRAIVMDTDRQRAHPMTGQLQPVQVYSGTLAECHEWVRLNRISDR